MSTENHGRRRATATAPNEPRRRVLAGVARVTLVGALVASIGGVLVAQAVESPDSPFAPTPAATALDLRDTGDLASRSELAGRIALDQQPAMTVRIVADGATIEHTTRAATLAEALAEAGITVDADDVASTALGSEVHDGMDVTIQRVEVTQVIEEVVDPHQTTRVETSTLLKGTEKVTTDGVDGLATHTYRVTVVDGVEVAREIVVSAIARQRVDEVVSVGTKAPVAAAPRTATNPSAPSSGPVMAGSNREIGASLAAARGWTGSQWQCLDALFQRESGWNHLASNSSSGAYGIPQALPGSKMGTVAADWRTNPATQITWGLNYIAGRYGTPCGAWSHSQSVGWY